MTVAGVSASAIIAIAAVGLVVTYTTSGIFNFSQGAMGMMAAFTYWQFTTPSEQGGWGVGTIPALILVVGVMAPLFGWLVEVTIMRQLPQSTEAVRVVVTVALLLFLFGLANVLWPQNVARRIPKFFAGDTVRIFGVNVEYNRIIILVTAVIIAVILRLFLYRTRAGVAMRAAVDDRSLLQLNGGRPHRSAAMAWAIGASLAAVAGVLTAMEFELKILTLSLLVVKAFTAAVIGKLRSLPMACVGALIIGLSESYVGGYFPDLEFAGFDLSNLQFAVAPILLFVVHDRPAAGTAAGGSGATGGGDGAADAPFGAAGFGRVPRRGAGGSPGWSPPTPIFSPSSRASSSDSWRSPWCRSPATPGRSPWPSWPSPESAR